MPMWLIYSSSSCSTTWTSFCGCSTGTRCGGGSGMIDTPRRLFHPIGLGEQLWRGRTPHALRPMFY